MEEITSVVSSALNSIGAVQSLVVAAVAGFLLKDFNKLALFTVGALLANSLVTIVRSAINGAAFSTLVQSNLSSFFALTMRTFLIYAISFGIVIALVFVAKSQLKKI